MLLVKSPCSKLAILLDGIIVASASWQSAVSRVYNNEVKIIKTSIMDVIAFCNYYPNADGHDAFLSGKRGMLEVQGKVQQLLLLLLDEDQDLLQPSCHHPM